MSRRKPLSSSKPAEKRHAAPSSHGGRTASLESEKAKNGISPKKERPAPRPRRKKLIRPLVLPTFLLSTLIVGGVWLAHSSFLRVQHVSVAGTVHEGAAEVLSHSGLLAHPTMLGLTDRSVLANLAMFPWITGVTAHRQWPNTVVLRIYETHAVAVAYNVTKRLEYVGVEGQDLGPAPQNADLPTLSMVVASRKWPYAQSGFGAVTVAQAIPASFGNQISRISESPNGSIRVTLTTPVTFVLGPAVDLEKKFVAMASVIANYTLSSGETIDVTIPGEIAVTPAKG